MWHFDSLGDGHSSAAVTKDRIYTAGMIDKTGYVFALTLDGKLLWKVAYGEEWSDSWPGTRTTPLISDGKLYIQSGLGKIFCMNVENGAMLWKLDMFTDLDGKNIKWGVTENFAVDGNKLFCTIGGTEANVVALDKNTGKVIWKNKGNGEKSAYCSPAIINWAKKKIIVTQTEKSILGIEVETGNLLWSFEHPNKYSVHANTPLFDNGYLYCVSGYGKGGVMLKLSDDASKVEKVWSDSLLDNRMGGFVLYKGKIYGSGDFTKAWHCLDWKTGKQIASEKVLSKNGTTILAEDMLYCFDEAKEVALVEPLETGFKKVSSFKAPFGSAKYPPWAHLVINKGKLYVRYANSLMVFDIKKK